MNLRAPYLGGHGDWHQRGSVTCLVDNVPDEAHWVRMSNHRLRAEATSTIIALLRDEDIVDGCEALANLGHPTATLRTQAQPAAGHARAGCEGEQK